MDNALKFRLTGAAILILLAVALLPELLTGSGRASRNDAATSGAQGGVERRIDIDLTADASAPTDPIPELSQPSPPPAPVVLPVPSAAPTAAPAPTVASAPTAMPVPTAAPTPSPVPSPAPAAAKSGSYYVQLGVFVNRASANNLARKLRERKFPVLIEPLERQGKTLYRVRVGPEADRAAANALAKRLADAGHKGSVVK